MSTVHSPAIPARLTQHALPSAPNSTILTLSIGTTPPRLFAAHTDILLRSPFFATALRSHLYNPTSRVLSLPDEIPEVFSCVLEHLYKGDYTPRLLYDARRQLWSLEPAPAPDAATVWIPLGLVSASVAASPTLTACPHPTGAGKGAGVHVLKDTAVYCAAERYALPQLKKLALRKQGLQTGIAVATILASARYAYAHTPESDRHLRAHYLALIIRSRNTFKKSGTMQLEMAQRAKGAEAEGTGLWFDLFVAMCNHLVSGAAVLSDGVTGESETDSGQDDVEAIAKSPR